MNLYTLETLGRGPRRRRTVAIPSEVGSEGGYFFAALRRGVRSGTGFPAFTALRIAISANIGGLVPSTAASSISLAIFHSGRLCFALGRA